MNEAQSCVNAYIQYAVSLIDFIQEKEVCDGRLFADPPTMGQIIEIAKMIQLECLSE